MGILRTDIISHSQLESAGGSVEFDGSGDYLTIPYGSGVFHFTEDYTIDFYIKFTTNSGTQRVFGQRLSNASDISVLGEFASNNFLYYYSQNGGTTEYLTIGSYGTNIELNTWHHVAIVCDGGVHHSYLDGVLTSVNVNNPPPLNYSNTDWAIGRQGAYTANEFSGSIYSFRITTGALYKGNFTVPKFKPKVLPGTLLLCCQSSTSVTEAAVSVAGDITSNGDPQIGDTPLLKEDITDTGVVFDGVTTFDSQAYFVPPGGNTRERIRGRGLFAGGDAPIGNVISSIEIQSQGNAVDFGDMTQGRLGTGSVGSSTRGLISSGYTQPANANVATIDFVTIANTSNATTFGDSTQGRHELGASSSETRAIFGGGTSPSLVDTIDFVTIATAGDASDFGNLTQGRRNVTGVSSPTRSVFMGGRTSGDTASDILDFVTIASTGDATDFGDLTAARGRAASVCSSTRGIMCGGETPTAVNTIDFITIASAGNATDFGDCISIVSQGAGGASNKTRGAFCVAYIAPAYTNAIQFVTIATTGNSADFGDNTVAGGRSYGFSDSHGGLS